MKISTLYTLLYFFLFFIYKFFGNNSNDYWVCSFWLVTGAYLGTISLQLYHHFFSKKEKIIWISASVYWWTMVLIHIYLIFNIKVYRSFADTTNKITLGTVLIVILYSFLFLKNIKNDKKF